MSHYTTIGTRFRDQDALVEALTAFGMRPTLHAEAIQLINYLGRATDQRAHVVVTRDQIGNAANDLGFERLPNGNFRAHISDYDSGHSGLDADFVEQLTQRYAYHLTVNTLAKQGFAVSAQEQGADRRIHLTLRRSA